MEKNTEGANDRQSVQDMLKDSPEDCVWVVGGGSPEYSNNPADREDAATLERNVRTAHETSATRDKRKHKVWCGYRIRKETLNPYLGKCNCGGAESEEGSHE